MSYFTLKSQTTFMCTVSFFFTCWWSDRGLHTCFRSCTSPGRSMGRLALRLYTCKQSAVCGTLMTVSPFNNRNTVTVKVPSCFGFFRGRERKKWRNVNVRHTGMWMLWPFDDGPRISLHSTEQFDRGLLPHGVRPQGNHEVRHLGDFIQVIRPLKHHFLDLERGKWCQLDVCGTVYMSSHIGSQRWVRFGPMTSWELKSHF